MFTITSIYILEFGFLHSFLLIGNFVSICHFCNVPIWPISIFTHLSFQIRIPTLLFRIVNLPDDYSRNGSHSILRPLNLHLIIANNILFRHLCKHKYFHICNQSTHFYWDFRQKHKKSSHPWLSHATFCLGWLKFS